MARSATVISQSHVALRRSYYWPEQQITFWIVFMVVTGVYHIYLFARLGVQQGRLGLGTPWIIPFGITVGGLTEFCTLAAMILVFQRRLLPGVVLLFAFPLLVLFIAGLIGTSVQLFGPVAKACQENVYNRSTKGVSLDTLAWLLQDDICTSWYIAFAFWVAGTLFWIWIMVVARMVISRSFR